MKRLFFLSILFAGCAAAQNIRTLAGGGPVDGAPASQVALGVGYFGNPIAADAFGNVYIASEKQNRVIRIGPDGTVVTIAGNGATGNSGDGGLAVNAMLNQPQGVAVDGSGSVYIADSITSLFAR